MSIALVTGSAGLIGSETCRRFSQEGFDIVGIDNDMRAEFFGADASTASTRQKLQKEIPSYQHLTHCPLNFHSSFRSSPALISTRFWRQGNALG